MWVWFAWRVQPHDVNKWCRISASTWSGFCLKYVQQIALLTAIHEFSTHWCCACVHVCGCALHDAYNYYGFVTNWMWASERSSVRTSAYTSISLSIMCQVSGVVCHSQYVGNITCSTVIYIAFGFQRQKGAVAKDTWNQRGHCYLQSIWDSADDPVALLRTSH